VLAQEEHFQGKWQCQYSFNSLHCFISSFTFVSALSLLQLVM
jgi:hypothetical protein